MAWIEKRPGRRGTSYRVGWRDPAGRPRARTFHRAGDAQRFARDIERGKDAGTYVDPALGRVTLEAFWGEYLAGAANLRPSTRARYETHGRLYILPALGERPVGAITVADVKRLFAELGDRGIGAATQESVQRILHRVFEVALEEDRVGRNPVRGVRIARAPRRAIRFLDESEVRSIAEETPERFRTLVYCLAYSGLRIGEAVALRVRNVDLTRGLVRVVESTPEVRGTRIPGETKTRRARAVPLPAFLRDMLAEHLAAFGAPGDLESFVFTGPGGHPVRQNAFRKRVFQPAAERAGVTPTPSVHALRHTAASLMAKAGLSMREAQEVLGHSRATMTDRYTHLWPDELAEKVGRLDALGRAAEERAPAAVAALPIAPHR